jgi:hypothetical protein
MATKQEWSDYFKLINDREPTLAEFENAVRNGEITDTQPQTQYQQGTPTFTPINAIGPKGTKSNLKAAQQFASYAFYGYIAAVAWSIIFLIYKYTQFSSYLGGAYVSSILGISFFFNLTLNIVWLVLVYRVKAHLAGPSGKGWSIFMLVIGILGCLGIIGIASNPIGAIIVVATGVCGIMVFVKEQA